MATAITARELGKHFAARTLFTGVALSVEDGERLALIGPNGSGKSTLLKILAGLDDADEGAVTTRKGLRTAYVAQADTFPDGATVLSAVAGALNKNRPPHLHDEHEVELAAEQTLYRVGFTDLEQPTASLSGGQRKRLSIARGLAGEPDLLLLDEPTNHLDVEGIDWLEDLLRRGDFASIVITHDRAFLETTATRIVELSTAYPQGTYSVAGGYEEFLKRKEEFLSGQAARQQALSGQVKEDLRWLARGAKARRTKSKARIDASFERMDELAALKIRNAPAKAAAIDFASSDRRTQKLLLARGISKNLGGKQLFDDVDVLLSPGQKLGLMGPNGSGKSTLIKVLTGEIKSDPPSPQAIKEAALIEHELPHGTPPLGTIKLASPPPRIVLFSQHRTELDPDMTLAEAFSPVDHVEYRGRQLHINTWAQMFLFTKDQLRSPMRNLSGGEQARVHIARLMLEPADILILDEPTNDLDIPSLEVLEESLEEFPGCVLLVTHDRAMLDRLATKVLALDGEGGAHYYADYQQWKKLQNVKPGSDTGSSTKKSKTPTANQGPAKASKSRLKYDEQKELDTMEGTLEKAEAEVTRLEAAMNDPAVMADRKKLEAACKAFGDAQEKVAALYARWTELEARK